MRNIFPMRYDWLIMGMVVVFCMFIGERNAAAAAEKIIFIAHDNRPISLQQTAEVMEQTGCHLLMPSEELLSRGVNQPGQPDELWTWLEAQAGSAQAAVLSTDSLLYGGLIASRRHEIPQETLQARVERFQDLHARYPNLKLYLFGSLMRTPKSGLYSGKEEPAYYDEYGADIFQYTALEDKADLGKLSRSEQAHMQELKASIPAEVLEDWLGRRAKNLSATKQLMDMVTEGVAETFVVGRDDNAPLCRTHQENRELQAYAAKKNIPANKFRSLTGIDEFNLLLFARAINDLRGEIPFVHVIYNEGVGADTIPAYSDEQIGTSIRDSLGLAGGMMVPGAERADFVLLVNTDPRGLTGESVQIVPSSAPLVNDGRERRGTQHFFRLVQENIGKGYPVGIADIAFSNGSDNALMEKMRKAGLLEKLTAYSGWNTATNSTGFALATGILTPYMTDAGIKRLLTRRYLDDWGYQANVRTTIVRNLLAEGHLEACYQLDSFRPEAEAQATKYLREFAKEKLSSFAFEGLQNLQVRLPWNRTFECAIFF